MVEKIAKDTTESRKLKGRAKTMIAAVAVLTVLLFGVLYLFFGWSGEVSKEEQVKDFRIADNELVIEVEVPRYYGRRIWYSDLDETGTVAHIAIEYNFGKAKEDTDVLTAPVNTDDSRDIFNREGMQRLEEIQIVTGSGKLVKSLQVTDEMRE